METETRKYIYIMDEDKVWIKVFLEDIYYIETMKSTHYCKIIFKSGIGKLHADITPLHQELNPYFFKTKASTLANLNLVQKVDLKNRILYFHRHIYCTYAVRVSKELKTLLKIQSYRI